MVREILIWPDPVLKKKASAVARVDDSIRTLVNDMFETMYAADGVGLAAPQIGVLKNVIVLDTTPRQPESKPVAMINPEIVSTEGRTVYTEGCLSIPGEAEDVERAAKVTVRFPVGYDVRGPPVFTEARDDPEADEAAQGRAPSTAARRLVLTTPIFGQSLATTQRSQAGLRAKHVRRPCQISS